MAQEPAPLRSPLNLALNSLREITVPVIRSACVSDAMSLSSLAESTFRAAFSAFNSSYDMDLHCRKSYSEAIQSGEIANQSILTLVAEEQDRLIGYAQLRWGDVPACVLALRPGEIQRLYVVEDWHGRGVAKLLMSACISELRSCGSNAAWVGVWERNPRAIAFYSRLGFIEVGEHGFLLGEDPQRDLIMVKPLSDGQII